MTSSGTLRFGQTVCTVCFFVVWGWVIALPQASFAQQKRYRPLPDYVQLGRPDQEVGRKVLREFQESGTGGNYYLEFQLRVMPRRGKERLVYGRLWESRFEGDSVRRIELRSGAAEDSSVSLRLLVRGGTNPAMWRWTPELPLAVDVLPGSALFEPIGGTDLTAFDLQMPFLFWTDVEFEGVRKVRGRPAHAFLFYPPSDYASWQPKLSGVRVYLDSQYNALVQVEQIVDLGKVAKSMSVLDLKKIDDQWIVKNIDVRDEASRNKTRFGVTGAALNEVFAGVLFTPAELSTSVRPPGDITRIEP